VITAINRVWGICAVRATHCCVIAGREKQSAQRRDSHDSVLYVCIGKTQTMAHKTRPPRRRPLCGRVIYIHTAARKCVCRQGRFGSIACPHECPYVRWKLNIFLFVLLRRGPAVLASRRQQPARDPERRSQVAAQTQAPRPQVQQHHRHCGGRLRRLR
jgi:hypothetical protein